MSTQTEAQASNSAAPHNSTHPLLVKAAEKSPWILALVVLTQQGFSVDSVGQFIEVLSKSPSWLLIVAGVAWLLIQWRKEWLAWRAEKADQHRDNLTLERERLVVERDRTTAIDRLTDKLGDAIPELRRLGRFTGAAITDDLDALTRDGGPLSTERPRQDAGASPSP